MPNRKSLPETICPRFPQNREAPRNGNHSTDDPIATRGDRMCLSKKLQKYRIFSKIAPKMGKRM
jgi:hypothetical protein